MSKEKDMLLKIYPNATLEVKRQEGMHKYPYMIWDSLDKENRIGTGNTIKNAWSNALNNVLIDLRSMKARWEIEDKITSLKTELAKFKKFKEGDPDNEDYKYDVDYLQLHIGHLNWVLTPTNDKEG